MPARSVSVMMSAAVRTTSAGIPQAARTAEIWAWMTGARTSIAKAGTGSHRCSSTGRLTRPKDGDSFEPPAAGGVIPPFLPEVEVNSRYLPVSALLLVLATAGPVAAQDATPFAPVVAQERAVLDAFIKNDTAAFNRALGSDF